MHSEYFGCRELSVTCKPLSVIDNWYSISRDTCASKNVMVRFLPNILMICKWVEYSEWKHLPVMYFWCLHHASRHGRLWLSVDPEQPASGHSRRSFLGSRCPAFACTQARGHFKRCQKIALSGCHGRWHPSCSPWELCFYNHECVHVFITIMVCG